MDAALMIIGITILTVAVVYFATEEYKVGIILTFISVGFIFGSVLLIKEIKYSKTESIKIYSNIIEEGRVSFEIPKERIIVKETWASQWWSVSNNYYKYVVK